MRRTSWIAYLAAMVVSLTMTMAGCGIDHRIDQNGTSGGTVTGKISNYSNGTGVAAATVTVGTATTTTAADGTYTLSGIPAGAGKVVNVTKADFALGSKVATVTNSATTRIDMSLLPVAYTTTFDPSTAQTLSANAAGTAQVVLPANALVTSSGAAPTGNVTANITPVDPALNPRLMPGNFSATVGTGAAATNGIIESYGAMEVTFTDSTGAALNLASGQTATIRIPLASGVTSPPATMPAYFYNATTGKWVEEGTLTLAGTAPNQYYTGTVTHFSYWNADMPLTTTCITGKVVDASGNAVAGARVEAQGRDYIGTSEAYSAADGTFTILVKSNSTVIVYASTSNALSQSVIVATGAAGSVCTALSEDLKLGAIIGSVGSGSAKITLTWGTNPDDLDSHLTGPPDPSGSATDRFHVYYSNKGSLAAAPFANLDVDDVTSFGPEVVTISKFFPGVYRYSVHHFSGSGTIFSSPARVELTLNGSTQVFVPPDPGTTAIGDDTVWQVFEISVSSTGEATVTPLNNYILNTSAGSVTRPVIQPFADQLFFSNLPAK
jgi:hypothetical protein